MSFNRYIYFIAGLNYLIEFVPDDANKNDCSIIWVCVLCGSTLTSDTLVKEHFVGKRHRYRYLVNQDIKLFSSQSKIICEWPTTHYYSTRDCARGQILSSDAIFLIVVFGPGGGAVMCSGIVYRPCEQKEG